MSILVFLSRTVTITLVMSPIFLLPSFAKTIERITVTGNRHQWPDNNIRQFYIHYASHSGLKTAPTALDFETFNDEKVRQCFREQLRIREKARECKATQQALTATAVSLCGVDTKYLGDLLEEILKKGNKKDIVIGVVKVVVGVGCAGIAIFEGMKAQNQCDTVADIETFNAQKDHKCD